MSQEILVYGEGLIDFSQIGQGNLGYPAYEALPGGAPANVAATLAKWGHKVGFAGRRGQDSLGELIEGTLKSLGVDVSQLEAVKKPTTMAIVSLNAQGDRSFDILWKGTACEALPVIQPSPGALPKIFHFGSVSMCDPQGRENTLATARLFKTAGCYITYDPNYRARLWDSPEAARQALWEGFRLADLVKIAEEEVAFLLEEEVGDSREQLNRLLEIHRPALTFMTLGPEGCFWTTGDRSAAVPALKVKVVDTTGAGDSFMAAILHKVLENTRDPGEAARFGVIAGSLTTTNRGGVPSIPELSRVVELFNANQV